MEPLYFKVNAEIKSVVGRDLINDDNIAVTELVKNAYDALSPVVNIKFMDINKPGLLVVEDYGLGMSRDDIEKKWLNIAYSEKKGPGSYPDKRKQAGNKGVGRFSCDRLGTRLDLYTHKTNGSYIHVGVDWERFENASQEKQVSHIPVDFEELSPDRFREITKWPPGISTGTRLEISNLRSSWGIDQIIKLRRDLERFANPYQGFENESFSITLECPQFDNSHLQNEAARISGPIRNTVFKTLGFKTSYIESQIDGHGREITTVLFHRGEKLFTLIERNRFAHLKNVKVVIYFLNQYQKAYFHRLTGMSVVDYGSIFLFLNGFRVTPYGNRGNDWLRLDNRKLQGARKSLGNRELLGRIEVNDQGNDWRIISSREGIIVNPAFLELTNQTDGFFYSALKKLERYVVQGLDWDTVAPGVDVQELTKKILHKKEYQGGEQYREPEKSKEQRILRVLIGIIAQSTKADDILLLEFDPGFMEMLSRQQDEEAKEFITRFQQVADRVDSVPQGRLKSFLTQAAEKMREVKDQRDYARQQAEHSERQKEKALEQRDNALAVARQKEEENLFLKATRNRDVDDVIDLNHQMLTWSKTVEIDISNSIRALTTSNPSIEKITTTLRRVSTLNAKILKVAKFITLANFRVKAVKTKTDIVSFLSRYIAEASEEKFFTGIEIAFNSSQKCSFETRFTPLEITILVDNLISNAQKAGAKTFRAEVLSCTDSVLEILFEDDGRGLSTGEVDEESIFSRGITTTDGSGIGLFHVRDILRKINGTVKVATSTLGGFGILIRIAK